MTYKNPISHEEKLSKPTGFQSQEEAAVKPEAGNATSDTKKWMLNQK